MKSIERNGGEFKGDIVRDIGKTYLVIRGFTTKKGVKSKKSKNPEESVTGISKLLNDRLERWPAAIEGRAKFCAKLAKDCQGKFSKNQLASAMTKLMWFARPTDWTMFDRYAANGLGVGAGTADKNSGEESGTAVKRMRNFYERLDKLDYKGLLEMIRPIVKKSKLDPRWAERIVDKYLMMIGTESPDKGGYHKLYLNGLPSHTRVTLTNLARQLDEKCGGHKLVNYLDERQSKAGKAVIMKSPT